jgi:hypothetical protein
MASTRLTVGGFTQPGVARNLMDLAANAEKGLSHRFLWVFPRPLYGSFDTLEKVDTSFQGKLGKYTFMDIRDLEQHYQQPQYYVLLFNGCPQC